MQNIEIDGKTFNEFMATELIEWSSRAERLRNAAEGIIEMPLLFNEPETLENFCESCIMAGQRVRRIADAWQQEIGDASEPMHRLAMSYSLLAHMPFAPDGIHHAMQYIKEVTHAIKYC